MKQAKLLAGLCSLGLVGCGGRLDVAELRDGEEALALQGQIDDDAPTAIQTSTPYAVATSDNAPTGPAPVEVLTDCFDPELSALWSPPPDGGIVLQEVPIQGCTFSASGDDDECTAVWACCGVRYVVEFSRERSPGSVQTSWSGVGVIGHTLSKPDDGEVCPLYGLGAAAVVADGFGYTPAWETALREAIGETEGAPELDPIPLGCTYVHLADCSGQLQCPDHTYFAGYDEAGEFECHRDGVSFPPLKPRDEATSCWEPGFVALVPADECFGPGWSGYFQLAAE